MTRLRSHTTPFWKGFKPFYTDDDGREGLYVNTAAVLIKVTGIHEPLDVLPAAISGILTVLESIFLPRNSSEAPSRFSAFLLATSHWHGNFFAHRFSRDPVATAYS